MKFSEVFTSKDNVQLDKKTLVFLRWIAIVGQFLTISIVFFFKKISLEIDDKKFFAFESNGIFSEM